MEKTLQRYTVSTIIILFLIGCNDHETPDHVIKTTEQSAIIPYDPLPSRSESPIEAGIHNVIRVVDGDTLVVGDSADRAKQYWVRLIGSDTPETVKSGSPVEAFGVDDSEFIRQKIAEANDRVPDLSRDQ